MKKMSKKRKVVAVLSGVLGLMMVGAVVVNGIGAKANYEEPDVQQEADEVVDEYLEYDETEENVNVDDVDTFNEVDGRMVYTMEGAKFRGYTWVKNVYGEKNFFGKKKIEGGTEFQASDDNDAILNFTVKGYKDAEEASLHVYQIVQEETGDYYIASERRLMRDFRNGEDKEVELRFPQKAGEKYRYLISVTRHFESVDLDKDLKEEYESRSYIYLKGLMTDKTPITEPFIIEAGGTLTY